jgi:hypothetical protein
MFRKANLLVSWLLRRHPAPEILQACADRELSRFEARIVRLHTSTCKQCREEMISAREALDGFRAPDVPPAEVLLVRERIICFMSGLSANQQSAINDVRRVLGTRAVNQFIDGRPTVELRTELAAFVGNHAADVLLHRVAA